MARKKINTMLKTPDGIFNAQRADVVTPTDKGVAILNLNGDLMCWIEVQDPGLRREISHLVSDRVYQAQIGENVEPIEWADYGLTVDGKPVSVQPDAADGSATQETPDTTDGVAASGTSDSQASGNETNTKQNTALKRA